DTAIPINQFLMNYCQRLLAEVADERFAEQPHPGVNHPAWILGHLALTADGTLARFGVAKSLPAEWATLFAAGSKPTPVRTDYPTKDALLQVVEERYGQLRQTAANAGAELLSQPTANPRAKDILPTLREMTAFILAGHLGVHLGQLSTWRRLIGLPPMF